MYFFCRIFFLIFFFFRMKKCPLYFALNLNEKATENLLISPLTHKTSEILFNQSQYIYFRYTQQILIKHCHNTTHANHVALQWYLFCKLSKTFQWISLTLTQGQWRDYFSSHFFPPGEKEDNGAEIELVLNHPYSKTTVDLLLHQLSSITGSSLPVLLKSPFLTKWKDHMYSSLLPSVSPIAFHNQTYHYITGRLPHEFLCTDTINVLFKYLMCEGKLGLAPLLHGSLETFPYRTIHVNISTTFDYDLIIKVTVSTVFQPSSMFQAQWNHSERKDVKTLVTLLGLVPRKEMQWKTCSYLSRPSLHILNLWMTKESLDHVRRGGFKNSSHFGMIDMENVSNLNSSIQLDMLVLKKNLPKTQQLTCYSFINNKALSPQRLEGIYVIQCVNKWRQSRILRYYGSLPPIIEPLLHTLQLRRDTKDTLWIHGMKVFKELDMTFHFPMENNQMISFVFQSEMAPLTTMVVQFTFWKQFVSRDFFAFAPEKGLSLPGGFYYVQLLNNEVKDLVALKDSFHYHLISKEEKVGTKITTTTWIRRTTGSMYVLYALPEINMTFNAVALVTCVVITFFDRITRFTLKRYTSVVKVTTQT